MADNNQDLWQWIATASLGMLTSAGLYKMKKVDDMPERYLFKEACKKENYLLKDDFQQAKSEIREDIQRSEDKLLAAINRLHERFDHRREEISRNGG